MSENIGAEIARDTELEQRLLEAVIADRNAQPRSQQLQVGPSQVGGCRELLRAGLFESDTVAEPETNWATAAHVGQVMGESLEGIFGERLDALTQQRITATFGMLGVQISGAVDLLFLGDDQISDLKSTDDIGGVLYDLKRNASAIETLISIRNEGLLYEKNIETADGGYELTEQIVSRVAKLHYYVQVAIYVVGAIQQGILSGDASARLVFYDRSGGYQGFVALVVSPEEIALFYDIAQMRLDQVVRAQVAYEQTSGNPAVIAPLRDMAPSYCFSPKVMCPRRMHCWAGSDWSADNRITNPDQVSAVNRYTVGRDLEKLGKGMKMSARADLKDVEGMLPDGKMLTWTNGGAINVIETTVTTPQTQARLDEFVPPIDVTAEVMAEQDRKASGVDDVAQARRAMRERELAKLQKPALVALCTTAQLEPKGVKATLIERILDHEDEHGEIELGDPDEVEESLKPAPEIDLAEEPMSPEEIDDLVSANDPELASTYYGGEADPEPQAERDPRIERVQFVDTDQRPNIAPNLPRPEITAVEVQPSTYFDGEAPADAQPQWAGAPQHQDSTRAETQKAGYEQADVPRRRQELFGLTLEELQGIAQQFSISTDVPRSFMIQAIIDAEFTPPADRGWRPNGEGTSGDPLTDKIRQMQYNSDPAMRRNYGSEEQR